MILSSASKQKIFEHAQKDYPSECCGIVTGTGDVQSVHQCRNLADELHEKDPETHPRTSHDAYFMDRQEMERIVSEAEAKGEKVIAFYHSHIDCGAYFSQMDKEVQTVFGEPEFPAAVHVVVAVYERQVRELKGYLWDGEKQDFVTVLPA